MRGKARPRRAPDALHGIPPAYAGKSSFSMIFIKISEDHPRLCGEKLLAVVWLWAVLGITPAYAGKR